MGKNISLCMLFVLFVFFVFANVYSSQNLHPLFFNLVGRQKKTDAIAFLRRIQKTTYFADQLEIFKKIYGESILRDLYAPAIARAEERKKLEALLAKNDKARDVLVKLAVLYYEDDNFVKAKKYYQKAKTIDPEVAIVQLDKL